VLVAVGDEPNRRLYDAAVKDVGKGRCVVVRFRNGCVDMTKLKQLGHVRECLASRRMAQAASWRVTQGQGGPPCEWRKPGPDSVSSRNALVVSHCSARRAWITVTARRGAGCREELTPIIFKG